MPDIQKLTKSATPWGWQEKFEKDFKEKYEIFIRGVPEGKEAFFCVTLTEREHQFYFESIYNLMRAVNKALEYEPVIIEIAVREGTHNNDKAVFVRVIR